MAQLPNKKMINRMTVVLLCFVVIGFGAIVGRLFYLQILQHDHYQKKAVDQQTWDTVISPKRGTIYDRNKKALAVSASVETVVISPRAIAENKQEELVASGLSEILGMEKQTILDLTAKTKSQYETVMRKIEPDLANQVRQFVKEKKVKGITLIEDSKRYYPYGSFASHMIGFTGSESQGLWGAEAYYDSYLKGTPGRIISAKNARGTDMSFAYEQYVDAENGYDLVLTLDEVVQHYLEKHLEAAVIDNNVTKGGIGIVFNVNTGEILGASVKPDYDLNQPFTIVDEEASEALAALEGEAYKKARSDALQNQWRNRMISDSYEPGSVFKIITAAIALEEGKVTPADQFQCNGYLMVGGRRINCHKTSGHGPETFTQGIQNSCNPVAMTVAARVGSADYMNYIRAFGLTEKTGVDIAGETTGIFHSDEVFQGPVELATTSFGQTFTITPLQMITAAAAAVNGGYLVTPHIAKALLDSEGNEIKTFGTKVKRQVISAETSAQLTAIMESVVSVGTGKNAYITGYKVGGKTGTTLKTTEKNEAGEAYKKLVSFLAIAPSDHPEVAVLIILDEPQVGPEIAVGGGSMAAPVAQKILEDILPTLGVNPRYTPEELEKLEVAVPNVVNVELSAACASIEKMGVNVRIAGEGGIVLGQLPKSGQAIPRGGTIILYTNEGFTPGMVAVPDLLGLSEADAKAALQAAGLNMRTGGVSVKSEGASAAGQSEAAGAMVPEGTVVTVDFLHQVSD